MAFELNILRQPRHAIPEAFWEQAMLQVQQNIADNREKHGDWAHASPHEILGDLHEEAIVEFAKAVHENDLEGMQEELRNIATASIWGLASIQSGQVQVKWT